MRKILTACLIALLFGVNTAYAGEEDMRVRASGAAKQLLGSLKGKLKSTIKQEGFAKAVKVCSMEAAELTAEVGGNGLEIKRVTLKPRNPNNAPDRWEADRLSKMENDLASKKLKEFYDGYDTIDGKKIYRFMKPLRVGTLCQNCHGTKDKLNKQAIETIREIYPKDKATGYNQGELRGAVSVKIDLQGD